MALSSQDKDSRCDKDYRIIIKRLVGRQTLWSIDLRSATDRMPLSITAGILMKLFGEELWMMWAAILTREVSIGSLKVTGVRTPVMFSRGTPLGALSAWPLFAITHHLLVQRAARLAGWDTWYPSYAIVGDDLVLSDFTVGDQYLSLLNTLTVGVSPEKTLKSSNGSCEFCSRFLWSGVDVSPISYKAVTAASRRSELVPSLLSRLSEWRTVSLAESLRVLGWKYKSLAKIQELYSCGYKVVSRRKFYGWLLLFSPLRKGGMSWEVWLSAGRRHWVSPCVIGRIHQVLFERWAKKFTDDGISFEIPPEREYDELDEEVTLRPWLQEVLVSQSKTFTTLAGGDIISPFLLYVPAKVNLLRTGLPQGKSREGKGSDLPPTLD